MKIAIIGGIGSGKSAALSILKEEGYFTLSADEINKELLNDKNYVEKIKEKFPSVVEKGVVNKVKLSNIVFSDSSKREELNSIAHPEIAKKIKECEEDKMAVELPLALESGVIDIFDQIILIDTSEKVRVDRLILRGLSLDKIKSIISAQVDVKELRKIATIIINNDGTTQELKDSILTTLSNL